MASHGRARGTAGRGLAGRGARSTTPGSPARQPNPETLARLGVSVEGKTENGQFEDAVEQDKATDASPATSSIAQPSPIERNQGNIEVQQTPVTTSRDSENESFSFGPNTPEFSPPSESTSTKLNPSAPAFSPTGSKSPLSPASSISSKLNPSTPEFSPTGTSGNYSNTSHSNTQSSTTRIHVGKYSLNPQSGEFIPKSVSHVFNLSSSSLNASAPAFVPQETLPTVMQNGQLENEEGTQDNVVKDEEEPLSLTPNDIICGFPYPIDQRNNVASESLLKATAEMLIKSTIYPASFDRWKLKLEHTVKAWPPVGDSLINLAEMLIHWGIKEPSLRLSSSRICQVLNDMELLKGDFNRQLVVRLQHWFGKRTTIEKDRLVNFSLFYAEMFSRLRTKDQETPIHILGMAVRALLKQLLVVTDEQLVIGACHVLKLTGSLLDRVQTEGDNEMDEIIKTLERLSTDETLPLSSKCVEIMVRVLELHARRWGHAVPFSNTSPAPTALSEYLLGPGATAQEEGSAEKMASEVDSHQTPVSNPEEWNEFLDYDNELIEDNDISTNEGYVIAAESGQEDDIDAEMRKEFEFFVQDLEDHLLNMGEIDPEQFQEEQ